MQHRTPATTAVDAIAVVVATATLGLLAFRVARALQSPLDVVLALLMCAVGYLAADALTGLVHWFCDTFFDETTPVLGPGLIAPFREHHRNPLLMTRHGFLELTGSSFRALAPLLVIYLWWFDHAWIGLDALVFAVAAGGALTNLLHRWAHESNPPVIARVLHHAGIVLTPGRHARHHAPPYAAAYCVTSGWLNPVFERWRVWTRAEAALVAVGLPLSRGDRD
jgi:ubiquitin-conjugating enzyme E2 variant